jgi:hypothetical protein
VTHADVISPADHPWSDKVVDCPGNVYVGNIGFNPPLASSPWDRPPAPARRGAMAAVEGVKRLWSTVVPCAVSTVRA